jgi:2-oxoglutarate dehydrogenase E1 component
METFQMSQTRGFKTGGTVHIVINNQVGFTISNPLDSRSTEYATDVAKMIQAPILHVNGDDPEAVLFVTQLAIDYRMQFKRDVVIDLVCYRRRGHNEADEPSGTQPLMYQQITKQRTTRELYADRLTRPVCSTPSVSGESRRVPQRAGQRSARGESLVKEPNKELFVDWRPYLGHAWTARHDTRFDLKTLQELSAKLLEIPEGFVVQRQVAKIYEDRQKMQAGGLPINWGYAETMAYATLAFEGHPIRMTGQDIGRGTFSHRHAVLHNQKDAGTYIPLQEPVRRSATFRPVRLVPVGRSGTGLRIRLLDHHAERAGDLGSPVRRLRQRCTGGDRPVHHQRRAQVGPSVRSDHAAAARL